MYNNYKPIIIHLHAYPLYVHNMCYTIIMHTQYNVIQKNTYAHAHLNSINTILRMYVRVYAIIIMMSVYLCQFTILIYMYHLVLGDKYVN